MRCRSLALHASLLLCLGCVHEPPADLAIWSEFLPYEEVRAHVATLSEFGAELYIAVRPDGVDDELWTLFEEAGAAGVAVRPWLQLPEEGVWLNEQNVSAFADFAWQLLDRASETQVSIEWLIFDLEPGFAYAEALRSAAASADAEALFELVATHRDANAFEAASITLRELIEELHARGVKAMAVTLPWTIDDLKDCDADFQDIFDTPLAGIPWDQVSVMVYRPVFADLFGVRLSPGYVASYARSLRAAFGPEAQVAIGNISTAGLLVPAGYVNPIDLRLDISAARSAGIDSVSVFSLDGMVVEGGPEHWLLAASVPTLRLIYLDPVTAMLRAALRWLDRLTDERPANPSKGVAAGSCPRLARMPQ